MAKTLEQMTLAELGDELNVVVHEAREILTTAEKDGKTIDTLEPAQADRIRALNAQIPNIKALQSKKKETVAILTNIQDAEQYLSDHQKGRTPAQGGGGNLGQQVMWKNAASPHLPRAYNRTQILGTDGYHNETVAYLRGGEPGPEMMRGKSQIQALMAGSVGMSNSNEERGGYFTISEVFSSELLKNVDDQTFMQQLCRVFMMPAGAQNFGIRVRTSKASSFQFGQENTDISAIYDTALKYGKRIMTPHKFHGSCIISKDLIRNFPGGESMIIGELALNASEVLEQIFLYGNGNQRPLGIMTPSTNGISTARDFATGNTARFTFDDWVQLKYSLKPRYRTNAKVMTHRYMLRDIALLKDGESRYLWEPSRQVGSPDTILGMSFVESEWMPSTKVTGGYFAIIGDFQYYYIIWDMAMEMQRLNEMRANTDEYVYLFRSKMDGQPVLEEAFSRGVFL